MHRLYANTTPFYMGLERPWILYLHGSWNQSPSDIENNCVSGVSLPEFKFLFRHLLASVFSPEKWRLLYHLPQSCYEDRMSKWCGCKVTWIMPRTQHSKNVVKPLLYHYHILTKNPLRARPLKHFPFHTLLSSSHLLATSGTVECQASLSLTISQSLLKFHSNTTPQNGWPSPQSSVIDHIPSHFHGNIYKA